MRWQQVPINLGDWSWLQYITAVSSLDAGVQPYFDNCSEESIPNLLLCSEVTAHVFCICTSSVYLCVWPSRCSIYLFTKQTNVSWRQIIHTAEVCCGSLLQNASVLCHITSQFKLLQFFRLELRWSNMLQLSKLMTSSIFVAFIPEEAASVSL